MLSIANKHCCSTSLQNKLMSSSRTKELMQIPIWIRNLLSICPAVCHKYMIENSTLFVKHHLTYIISLASLYYNAKENAKENIIKDSHSDTKYETIVLDFKDFFILLALLK